MDFKEDLNKAIETLRRGGVILYPTDTIWGLGCDASNPEAVEKIYKIKKRSDAKAMLSLVGSEGQLQQFIHVIPEAAWQLIDVAVSPLTIIYDSPVGIAPNLKAEDGSAGFRISTERFSSELCKRLHKPVVSTSANVSGEKSPCSFSDISQEIIDAVDYVVEYGRDSPCSNPSNVIKISDNGVVKILR